MNYSVVLYQVKNFDLPVILEDELKERVDDAIFIAACTGSQSPNVLPPYYFTNGTLQLPENLMISVI